MRILNLLTVTFLWICKTGWHTNTWQHQWSLEGDTGVDFHSRPIAKIKIPSRWKRLRIFYPALFPWLRVKLTPQKVGTHAFLSLVDVLLRVGRSRDPPFLSQTQSLGWKKNTCFCPFVHEFIQSCASAMGKSNPKSRIMADCVRAVAAVLWQQWEPGFLHVLVPGHWHFAEQYLFSVSLSGINICSRRNRAQFVFRSTENWFPDIFLTQKCQFWLHGR